MEPDGLNPSENPLTERDVIGSIFDAAIQGKVDKEIFAQTVSQIVETANTRFEDIAQQLVEHAKVDFQDHDELSTQLAVNTALNATQEAQIASIQGTVANHGTQFTNIRKYVDKLNKAIPTVDSVRNDVLTTLELGEDKLSVEAIKDLDIYIKSLIPKPKKTIIRYQDIVDRPERIETIKERTIVQQVGKSNAFADLADVDFSTVTYNPETNKYEFGGSGGTSVSVNGANVDTPNLTGDGNVQPTVFDTNKVRYDVDLSSYAETANVQLRSEKSQANGYPTLDPNAKIPISQLPDEALGNTNYKGDFDASTGTYPSGTLGDLYYVSVAGTVDGDDLNIGDAIIYDGTEWDVFDNTTDFSNYFTKSESDNRFAAIVHNHDDRYYTETESDSKYLNPTLNTLPVKGANGFVDSNITQLPNGNVGIGTTSPTEKLHVVGDGYLSNTSGSTVLKLDKSAAGTSKLLFDIGGIAYGSLAMNSAEQIDISGNFINFKPGVNGAYGTAMSITNTGNVGIGTTSPGYKLDVNGTGRFNGDLQIGDSGTGQNNTKIVSGYSASNYLNLNNATVQLSSGATAWPLFLSSGGHIWTRPAGNGALWVSRSASSSTVSAPLISDELFRVEGNSYLNGNLWASGNVGIGTTAPVAKLDVIDTNNQFRFGYDATKYSNLNVNSAGTFVFDSTGNMNFNPAGGAINIGSAYVRFDNNQSIRWGDAGGSSRPMLVLDNSDIFQIGNTGITSGVTNFVSTGNILMNGGGNLGIGITPTQKLHVSGNGLFTGSVSGAINPYDATTWNGSAKFATEDAVRDKIESMGGGGATTLDALTDKTTDDDIEITDPTKGYILRSPDNTRWRITVDNTGNLITNSL